MNDINGFGEDLTKFAKKSHTNEDLETIKNGLKAIFKKFDVNDSDLAKFSLTINNSNETSVETKNVSSYIDKISKKIFEREEHKKKQSDQTNNNNKDSKDENHKNENGKKKNKPKFNLSFDLSSIGSASPEDLEKYFESILIKKGFEKEDLNKTGSGLNILDFNDRAMDLNVSPDIPFVEQLVEISKKLYKIMVNGEDIETVRQQSIYSNPTTEKQTQFNLDQPGDEFDVQGLVTSKETAPDKINVSLNNQNGNTAVDIENTTNNDLTQKDIEEIDAFGIEGINTHAEMEEFRQSEEYELLQNMQGMAMEKSTSSVIDDLV